jgi:hypothetical protein
MYLQEVGLESINWIDLAQDGDNWQVLANALMNLHVP